MQLPNSPLIIWRTGWTERGGFHLSMIQSRTAQNPCSKAPGQQQALLAHLPPSPDAVDVPSSALLICAAVWVRANWTRRRSWGGVQWDQSGWGKSVDHRASGGWSSAQGQQASGRLQSSPSTCTPRLDVRPWISDPSFTHRTRALAGSSPLRRCVCIGTLCALTRAGARG